MHRIRRTRWSVRTGSQEQALAVRQWLRDRLGSELHEALAAAFEGAAPGDEVVRLDRLEIAFVVGDVTEVPRSLAREVGGMLRRRLRSGDRQEVVRRQPLEHGEPPRRPALLEYLLTGNVAWPMRPEDAATFAALVEAARHDEAAIAADVARCAADPVTQRHAIFRLRQLLEAEGPTATPPEVSGEAPMGSAPPPRGDEEGTEPTWRTSEPAAARPRPRRRQHSAAEDGSVDRNISHPRRPAPRPPRAGPPVGRPPGDPAGASSRPVEASPSERTPLPIARAFPEGSPTEFALAVVHAGLVLVHPFLPQLAQAVGLGAPRAWDPASDVSARMAALLHFLATGRDVPYELELGFIKILLGFRPETAMAVGSELLQENDRREAETLLRAVVAHWPALKRTSIAAVRASFLQRAGLVRADENGWRLALEPGPFDVLLQRLPWSLSVVKLPWTSMPIHCSWTNS